MGWRLFFSFFQAFWPFIIAHDMKVCSSKTIKTSNPSSYQQTGKAETFKTLERLSDFCKVKLQLLYAKLSLITTYLDRVLPLLTPLLSWWCILGAMSPSDSGLHKVGAVWLLGMCSSWKGFQILGLLQQWDMCPRKVRAIHVISCTC